jgi:lysocardiolipin and lysophospholipid acyltransferase
MYWRRFLVRDIPTEPTAFESWVLERWREKDALLEYFHQHNRFPADDDSIVEYRLVPNGAGVTKPVPVTSYVETMLRPGSRVEFLQMFVPILAVGLILHLVRRLWRWALVTLAIRS